MTATRRRYLDVYRLCRIMIAAGEDLLDRKEDLEESRPLTRRSFDECSL